MWRKGRIDSYKLSSPLHEHTLKKQWKKITFVIVQINLIKKVKDFYNKNYETLKKHFRRCPKTERLSRLRDQRTNAVKQMVMLPKVIYIFNAIPNSIELFYRNRKTNPKINGKI